MAQHRQQARQKEGVGQCIPVCSYVRLRTRIKAGATYLFDVVIEYDLLAPWVQICTVANLAQLGDQNLPNDLVTKECVICTFTIDKIPGGHCQETGQSNTAQCCIL